MNAYSAIRYIIYFLLIVMPLARGFVQGWAVCLVHIVTVIALTIFLTDKTLRQGWERVQTPLDKPLIALILLLILSTLFSQHIYTSLNAIFLASDYIVLFYLAIHTIQTRARIRTLFYIIFGTGLFLSVLGLFKMIGINPFPWWNYTDIPQDTAGRLSSTYGNPDHLAGYMEMAIPLALGFLMTDISLERRLVISSGIFLMTAALLLSLSRGGWIGLGTGLAFMLAAYLNSRYSKHKKLIMVSAFVLMGIATTGLSSTAVVPRAMTFEHGLDMPGFAGRTAIWRGITDMIRAYPLIGTGPGTFAVIFTQFQTADASGFHYKMGHNDYLHFISETGIPLAAVIIWMIFACYKNGFRKLKSSSRMVRGMALGSMGSITAILVHSVADFNLHIPANAALFLIVVATGMMLPCDRIKNFHKIKKISI